MFEALQYAPAHPPSASQIQAQARIWLEGYLESLRLEGWRASFDSTTFRGVIEQTREQTFDPIRIEFSHKRAVIALVHNGKPWEGELRLEGPVETRLQNLMDQWDALGRKLHSESGISRLFDVIIPSAHAGSIYSHLPALDVALTALVLAELVAWAGLGAHLSWIWFVTPAMRKVLDKYPALRPKVEQMIEKAPRWMRGFLTNTINRPLAEQEREQDPAFNRWIQAFVRNPVTERDPNVRLFNLNAVRFFLPLVLVTTGVFHFIEKVEASDPRAGILAPQGSEMSRIVRHLTSESEAMMRRERLTPVHLLLANDPYIASDAVMQERAKELQRRFPGEKIRVIRIHEMRDFSRALKIRDLEAIRSISLYGFHGLENQGNPHSPSIAIRVLNRETGMPVADQDLEILNSQSNSTKLLLSQIYGPGGTPPKTLPDAFFMIGSCEIIPDGEASQDSIRQMVSLAKLFGINQGFAYASYTPATYTDSKQASGEGVLERGISFVQSAFYSVFTGPVSRVMATQSLPISIRIKGVTHTMAVNQGVVMGFVQSPTSPEKLDVLVQSSTLPQARGLRFTGRTLYSGAYDASWWYRSLPESQKSCDSLLEPPSNQLK